MWWIIYNVITIVDGIAFQLEPKKKTLKTGSSNNNNKKKNKKKNAARSTSTPSK